MLVQSKNQAIVHFRSEVLPEVMTEDRELSRTIAWADANPVVWKIVTGWRSKAFGRKSCEYIGWAHRSGAPEAILERARHFHSCVDPDLVNGLDYRSRGIWGWRARFTFQHYRAKGFAGGFFQRYDGRYDRDCMTLDYTPEALPRVVRSFIEWAGSTPSASAEDVIKLDRQPLSTTVLDVARRLPHSSWDPLSELTPSEGRELEITRDLL